MANPTKDVVNERVVLLLGDSRRAEMQPLVRWLHRLVSQSSRLIECRDLESPLNHNHQIEEPIDKIGAPSVPDSSTLKLGEFPDLIVVLQSWPDEHSNQAVNRLLGYAPLARVVVCCGSWCESLGRNRDIWPVSVRVPIWTAPSRIQREWQSIQNSNDPNALPWSASREEVFGYDHNSLENWLASELVGVDSPDPSYHQYLLELIRSVGAQAVDTNARLLLFDVDPWNRARAETLKQYRDENRTKLIVALVNQVHSPTMSDLFDSGATFIVQKLGFQRQLH